MDGNGWGGVGVVTRFSLTRFRIFSTYVLPVINLFNVTKQGHKRHYSTKL